MTSHTTSLSKSTLKVAEKNIRCRFNPRINDMKQKNITDEFKAECSRQNSSLHVPALNMRSLSFTKDIIHESGPEVSHYTALLLNLFSADLCDFTGRIGDMFCQTKMIDICCVVINHIAHGTRIVDMSSIGADGEDFWAPDRVYQGLVMADIVTL